MATNLTKARTRAIFLDVLEKRDQTPAYLSDLVIDPFEEALVA